MRRTDRRETTPRLRVLGVGLVFLGVLLMHGLTGHGSTAMAEPVLEGHLRHAVGMTADVVAPLDPGGAVTAAPAASTSSEAGGHPGHLMVVGLCLALLVAAAALLLPRLRGTLFLRRRSDGAAHDRVQLGWRAVVPRPPDPTLLQVCRC